MNKWEIIDHTFKFRVGDSEEAGGCTLIGGEWKDVTTNDLFKNKNCLRMIVCINNLKTKELMRYIVYR